MSIENVINKLLRSDPEAASNLQHLAGVNIHLCCSDFPLVDFYCGFSANGIKLARNATLPITTHIYAPLYAFMMLLTQKEIDQQRLNIKINGDLEAAQQLQKMLSNLKIDWEEELSKYTGDIFAYQAIQQLKKIRAYQQENTSALEQMVSEYLLYESHYLPERHEVQDFMNGVDDLRLRVDRLEAKIQLLSSRNKQHESC